MLPSPQGTLSLPLPSVLMETRKLVFWVAVLHWRKYRAPILLEVGSLSGSVVSSGLWSLMLRW